MKRMNHDDHVALLRPGVTTVDGVWADFGSGDGAFTLALAELLADDAVIYSVDRDGAALRRQAGAFRRQFPGRTVHYLAQDFSPSPALPLLDGLIMANSLHFLPQKEAFLRNVRPLLRSGAPLLLVEYDTDRGNRWVPHPLSFQSWVDLAESCGFVRTELLAARPSRFLGRIFSAASWAPGMARR